MDEFNDYLEAIDDAPVRERVSTVLAWVAQRYPKLERRIAWNQPMFIDHGTFILGFSHTAHHLAVAPEIVFLEPFRHRFEQSGYSLGKRIIRITHSAPVPYDLLEELIDATIEGKKNTATFWYK
ncbi:MAG: DUF1801 domain-containing protein [Actinomycetaceae bacterium]|nr:DUF1801 domain-containing protein [Arcanobacterium sp.]MDD7505504.1 DUF1801 domain-containing protein [Actinomycetaceae bacterium]MDY6143485.1 DUF1801 domain-containing protein [Arcanobacterium sp.]